MLAPLSGCTGPKYNEKVLCEKRDGDKALQFIQYEQNEYPNLPQAGGHAVLGGVYFKNEGFGHSRWLFEGVMQDWKEYAEDACSRSSLEGDNIILHPVHRHYRATAQKLNLNRGIISTDGGRGFTLFYFPEGGPPYLKEQSGRELTYPRWITRTVIGNKEKIIAKQVKILTKPIELDGSSGKRITWLDLKGSGCEECEPVIARTIVSSDGGKNWAVKDFSVIKPEIMPINAVLPLMDRRMYWFNPKGGPNGRLVDCPADLSSLAEWPRKVCTLSDSMVIPLD